MSPLEVVLRHLVRESRAFMSHYERLTVAQDNAWDSLGGALQSARILLTRIDELRAQETAGLAAQAQIDSVAEASEKEVANLSGLLQSVGNN